MSAACCELAPHGGEHPCGQRADLRAFPARGEECRCCADCRLPYTVWYADNDLWNAVMRPSGYTEEPFLCARCFLIRAEPLTEFARVTWPETKSARDRARAPGGAPDPVDVEQLTSLLDAMCDFTSNEQRARYLLSCNWLRDRGAAAAARIASTTSEIGGAS